MENHPPLSAESQQYQQYYQHYQPQPQQQPEASNPSVAYDPSTQAYYAAYQHYDQTHHQQPEAQPNYTSYYYPEYSNSYQSQHQVDPSSIHPPGVTIQAENPQTLVQNHPDVYYSHGYANLQQQQPQTGYMAPGHSTVAARGGRGGRPIRGRGHHGSSRGRGRGSRGGGRGTSSSNRNAPGLRKQAAKPPPQVAWCDVCRVDCNTRDVLDQHMNGKKHKRNVKVYEEMQNLNKVQIESQNPQTQVPDPNPNPNLVAVHPEKKEAMTSDANPGNNNSAVATAGNFADKAESSGGGRGGGVKRKIKGARGGGKSMRINDGSRKPAEPAKPKQVVNLLCELCNVKCESQVVYDSHISGKKHITNLKKFQEHQAAMGSSVEALYPPIPKAPLTLQALYPPTTLSTTQADQQQQVPDAQALASTLVSQQRDLQDPQASQAALAQILSQHGINDAQSLLAQLIPFLLTQVLPNGASGASTSVQAGVPNSVPGLVTENNPNPCTTQVAELSCGENGSKSDTVVDESAQKIGADEKSDNGSAELRDQVTEPPPTMTDTVSTEDANVAANENASVAGGNVSCGQV